MGIRFLSSKLWAGAVICHCIFVQIWRDKVENKNRQKCIEQRHLVSYFLKKFLRRHFHSVFYPLCICIPISTFEHHLLQWLLNSCNSSTSTVQLVSNETRYGSSLFFLEKLQLLGSRVRVEKYANKNNFGQILHLLHGGGAARLDFYASIRKICRTIWAKSPTQVLQSQ